MEAGLIGPSLVGRGAELAMLRRFVEAGRPGRALLLEGAAGIGKTTLWEAGVAAARRAGLRVMTSRPASAEARLSFAALIDLFRDIDIDALTAVPEPQRDALRVSLLRAEPAGAPPEPRAIALGVLNALRAMARTSPLLVALDDVQWLDEPSTEALAFAARRLEHDNVALLLARRDGPLTEMERALEQRRLERVEVGPLGRSALRSVLSERLGLLVPRPVLRRLCEATLGNPFFALEVGRRLTSGDALCPLEELPVPETIEEALGWRITQLPPRVRRALLTTALGGDLDARTLAAVVGTVAEEEAVAAGVLAIDGDRVRVSHPLLAAAVIRHALPSLRRSVHAALAELVDDSELRAQHLALAARGADAALSAVLAAAADSANPSNSKKQANAFMKPSLQC